VCDATGAVLGTTLHGLFEEDAFRSHFLGFVAARRGRVWASTGTSYAAARERQIERIADACEEHLDTERLWRLVDEGIVSARARRA
jgi:adenosylcobyric acid synthase